MWAMCWNTGVIEFHKSYPKGRGMLIVAKGREKPLREFIATVTRHSYDGKTFIVPGIPENQGAAKGEALLLFRQWIKPQARKKGITVKEYWIVEGT